VKAVSREINLLDFDLTADQFAAAAETVQHSLAKYMRENGLRPAGGVRIRMTVPVEKEPG
jgi:hypothetical protein